MKRDLLDPGTERLERARRSSIRLLEDQADEVTRACLAMARRIQRGGRLLLFGWIPRSPDPDHVSIVQTTPARVAGRVVPAAVRETGTIERIVRLGRDPDILLAVSGEGGDDVAQDLARRVRSHGLLTVGVAGGFDPALGWDEWDYLFLAPETGPSVIAELQETIYGHLWELIGILFEEDSVF